MVRPIMKYSSTIWDPHTSVNINRVESIQRYAARMCFRNYSRYSSVTSMLAELNLPTLKERRIRAKLQLSEEDVLEALNSLDPDKSSGIDFIGPRVLNKCAYPLCGPLHHLFSTSLCKHTIPYDWRIHVITPVHKSGDKSQVNNYRPISLLSNTSKY